MTQADCDCCGKFREVSQVFVNGMETWACNECRGIKEWCERAASDEVVAGDPEIGAAGGIPRRIRMDQWCPAEKAIFDAAQVVEAMGADPRLTEAIILLSKARDYVADYVDAERAH